MNSDTDKTGFDIVVANYNNTQFLPDLIASIEAQQHTNWHLIIVDDKSTLTNSTYLSELEKHQKITVLYNKKNLGVCGAFHRGIEFGTNPIVGLVGADDTLPCNAAAKVIACFADNPDAAMLYTNATKCDKQMTPLGRWPNTSALDEKTHISNQIDKIFNFIAFRRAAYEQTPGLDISLRKAMDHDLILKLYEKGRIHYLEESLYNYRCHNNGISQGDSGLIAAQYSLLAQLRSFKRQSRSPLSKTERRKKHHLYHTRSVFIRNSCEAKPLLFHAIKSFAGARTYQQVHTSIYSIFRSLVP